MAAIHLDSGLLIFNKGVSMPLRVRVALCFVACLLASTGFAQQPASSSVPNLIRYSGTLKDGQATTVSSTPVGVTFAIYKQQDGGAPIWQETQNVTRDANGQYTVLLGTTTAAGLPDDLFSQQEERWLGIRLQGEAEQARILMVSVPYAFKAHEAETLGGLPASAFAKVPATDGTGSTTSGASGSTSQAAAANGSTGNTGKSGVGSDTVINCTTAQNNYIPLFTSARPPNIVICNSVMYQANGNIGIGTTTPTAAFEVDSQTGPALAASTNSTGAWAIVGANLSASGAYGGVQGASGSPNGAGVYAHNDSTTGIAIGIGGKSASPTGIAIQGQASAISGTPIGVNGQTMSPTGSGVVGTSNAPTGASYGVVGDAFSPDAIGVFGFNQAQTGQATGVEGQSLSTSGYGVFGTATAATGTTVGVFGESASPTGFGVYGTNTATSGETFGVAGFTASTAQNASGVYGQASPTTGSTNGVFGSTNSSDGNADGVYGHALSTSGGANGVEGVTESVNGYGVWGKAKSTDTSGASYGVVGQSNTGPGVYGTTQASVGVLGVAGYTSPSCCSNAVFGQNVATSGHNNGGELTTSSAGGVGGIFENTGGGLSILARVNASQNSFSVDGGGNGLFYGGLTVNGNGTLGPTQINGNLNVTGTLTKGGGSFKIDDPLDPANKYLSHSFVESPEMMNIYNGSVKLNAHGEAWVAMPEYFEALNRDFQYVLTAIGRPQPYLYIARKMAANRFKIAGGKPNAEVSWQVTGIRHDAWANAYRIPVEEEKPTKERGTYLHPELFGAGTGQSVNARLNQSQTLEQK
jgi:hypothetical protein